MRKQIIGTAIALVSFAGLAQANTVTGSIWENDPTGASNATVANVPGTTPNVTFTTTSPINFTSGGLYTIGEFINSGGGTTAVLTGAGELGHTLGNTLFDFKGSVTVTNGQTFTVGHDDGLTLVINGVTVVNQPLPTSFANTPYTWTGASGTYAFELVYGECCGTPARLQVSLPLQTAVPEPSTWAMMILGFAGVGFLAYRRRNQGPVLRLV
jgi:hypothetical protein